MSALPAVRRAVEEIDRNRPLIDPRTEESYLDEQAQYPRYYSMLLGLFAAVATGSGRGGNLRRDGRTWWSSAPERSASAWLWARAWWDVLKLVLRQALPMIASRRGAGIAGAMALTRFISSELWEVKAADPRTFVGVTLLLMSIAIIACAVPTRRAVRVDPSLALRHE